MTPLRTLCLTLLLASVAIAADKPPANVAKYLDAESTARDHAVARMKRDIAAAKVGLRGLVGSERKAHLSRIDAREAELADVKAGKRAFVPMPLTHHIGEIGLIGETREEDSTATRVYVLKVIDRETALVRHESRTFATKGGKPSSKIVSETLLIRTGGKVAFNPSLEKRYSVVTIPFEVVGTEEVGGVTYPLATPFDLEKWTVKPAQK